MRHFERKGPGLLAFSRIDDARDEQFLIVAKTDTQPRTITLDIEGSWAGLERVAWRQRHRGGEQPLCHGSTAALHHLPTGIGPAPAGVLILALFTCRYRIENAWVLSKHQCAVTATLHIALRVGGHSPFAAVRQRTDLALYKATCCAALRPRVFMPGNVEKGDAFIQKYLCSTL